MADKSRQLVLAGLSQAAAAGTTLLHPSRSHPGLFPSSGPGKQAARRCQDEGWLEPTSEDDTTGHLSYGITEAGFRHLLSQVDPREVLEDFVRVLERRNQQAEELLTRAAQMQASLAALGAHTRTVLDSLKAADGKAPAEGLNGLFRQFAGAVDPAPAADAEVDRHILIQLETYRREYASRDCPLPHLFAVLARTFPGLTLGRFHDALRRLHDAGAVYLHPWTGPLYEVPEPSRALLVGHEVAYYASIRIAESRLRNAD